MIDTCPPASELEAMLLGRLPSGRIAAVQRHLDQCPSCPARANGLKLESRLIRLLVSGSPQEKSTSPTPHLKNLMERLEHLIPGDEQERFDTICGQLTDDDGFPFLSPPQRDDELGRLAEYRVLRLLGRGGMGFVFLAEDTHLERLVGLKVLRPKGGRDSELRTRFLSEAKAMAAVKHDNIAVIHQVGVADAPDGSETLYLAMERLIGESLYSWMRTNPKPPIDWVIRMGRQAAAGLAAAHARGLIHRDVKPANLWLEAPPGWIDETQNRPSLGLVGRIKLIDFGLATNDNTDGSDPAPAAGTLAYMAPEQFGSDAIDKRVDLFSFGCVLYELTTGETPFPGRVFADWPSDGSPLPAAARDLNPSVPAELSDLIGRLLAEDPADRPPTAQAVELELAAIEERKPNRHRLKSPTSRVSLLAACAIGILGMGIFVALTRDKQGEGDSTTDLHARSTEAIEHPPFPSGPPDEWWCQQVADLPSQQQFRTVARKVEELNPGYVSARSTGWVEKEGVIRFTIVSDVVHDIRPVRGLPDVRTVRVAGTAPGQGSLTDISPLAGLRLHTILLENNPKLTDLSPLRGIRLTRLNISHTGAKSLETIDDDLIEDLNIADTAIQNIEAIRAMPRLQIFDCSGCPITSLEPLAGTPIRVLKADIFAERDEKILRMMPQLTTVNGMPIKEFWSSLGRNPD